jgi:ABC-type phosphate transport system substrate-binding protein
MHQFLKRPPILTLGLLLFSAALASCHNKSEEDPPVKMADTISLTGAGATFPYPIYSNGFDE